MGDVGAFSEGDIVGAFFSRTFREEGDCVLLLAGDCVFRAGGEGEKVRLAMSVGALNGGLFF
jgi:hypothetical protein